MFSSPILDAQKRAGASISKTYGWHLPSTYSSLSEEYEWATSKPVVLDRSYIGRLEITGRDGLELLNRLSTNDMDRITSPNQGIYTVLTSNKGRILDLLFVTRLESHLVVLTGAENRKKIIDWIEFYTFTEDVTVQDVTEETAMLSVMGNGASQILDDITGEAITSLPRGNSVIAYIYGVKTLILRTDFVNLPGFDIIVSSSDAEQIWTHLLSNRTDQDIKPVGMDAMEIIRIEQGVPLFGKELTENANPLEANLLEFISFSKGCYVGQEVVARLNTYKKVQKYLVGLSLDNDYGSITDADLFIEGRRIGNITSSVKSPGLGTTIGLGYVSKAHAKPGVVMTIGSSGKQAVAHIEKLPFR